METTKKLHPGQQFSPILLKRLDDADYQFGGTGAWQVLFVYRGKHCPICKGYLGKINLRLEKFTALGSKIAALSADSAAQARETFDAVKPNFPLLYGIDVAMMQQLGLYISEPRSPTETDHRFPEPGLFMIDPHGSLQIIDISNAPFVRPDLDMLLSGLEFVVGNDYPIRGTHR